MLAAMIIVFFMLGGGLIAAMLNMESEIVNGPIRPLHQIATTDDSWLLQSGTTNLIDDSFVSRDLVSELQSEGFDAIGFTKTYRSAQYHDASRQVIVFDIPANLLKGEAGVVVDESLSLKIGESFVMNDEVFAVTGLTRESSSLGKEGIFLTESEFQRLGMSKELISGVFINGSHIGEPYVNSYAVYTAEEFERVNLDYWVTNGGGLPLLLASNAQIYSLAVVLCVVALGFALTKRSIIMQRAIGMTAMQVAVAEALYLGLLWLCSIPLQLLMYWLLVGQFSAASAGYAAVLSVTELAFGATGMLLVVILYFVAMALYTRHVLKSQELSGKLASS